MILAIDTSDDQASVAIVEAGRICAEWSWVTRKNHSRDLIHVIRELLTLETVRPPTIDAIVVARGPGSFSGVRVGISVAKGLGVGLSAPVVGISTLDVIAFQAAVASPDVWAAMPLGARQIALAQYEGIDAGWRRVSDYTIVPLETACDMVRDGKSFAGAGADVVRQALRERGEQSPPERSASFELRRAGHLAELGRRYLDAGGRDQLHDLEPLYLRPSSAQEKKDSRSRS